MYWSSESHPQYEVSIKALIYDEKGRLFFAKDDKQKWDLPGGRLSEGDKNITECLKREIVEELGVNPKSISLRPYCVELLDYDDKQKRVFVAFKVELESLDFKPSEENVENRFVSREEFDQLDQAYQGLKIIKDQLFN